MAERAIKLTLTETTPTEKYPQGEDVTTEFYFADTFKALAFLDEAALNWTLFKRVVIEPADGREFF